MLLLAHSPMQDATTSPWLSNGAEGGEEDAWLDQESSYLSPHDDDVTSPSHSLASSSPSEPMDVLDGLSFGRSSSYLFIPLHTSSHLFPPLPASSHLFPPLPTSSHLFSSIRYRHSSTYPEPIKSSCKISLPR